MNKSLLKFIADFGPLLIFFVIYYKSGNNLSVAIPPLIVATIVAVAVIYFIEKKIPYIPLIGGVIISLFGGLLRAATRGDSTHGAKKWTRGCHHQ